MTLYEKEGKMALNMDAIGKGIGPLTKDYEWKDVVLYALGVGGQNRWIQRKPIKNHHCFFLFPI